MQTNAKLKSQTVWVIIQKSNTLRFYDLNAGEFVSLSGISFAHMDEIPDFNGVSKDVNGITDHICNHDKCAISLRENNIPVFETKQLAKSFAMSKKLTGFKYLKLNLL
ncbi:hypothetical protein L1077_16620 [Pseudoalteromonas luteoviolacea]|uniref:hypothetical protein n=1 Tax=Pseudoalteromonas luteoviolacea TaxID=43657 RepID=UPI001F2A5CB9|nr:hypothetical protein [Pseudoalteromonas luteoviolacea]MCF6441062.1 hypothetical protein [Pseudoalteromonas luteoviolacea]